MSEYQKAKTTPHKNRTHPITKLRGREGGAIARMILNSELVLPIADVVDLVVGVQGERLVNIYENSNVR